LNRLLGVVGGDEVVEDDQQEEEDSHQVGEHGKLNVGNHFAGFKTSKNVITNKFSVGKLVTWKTQEIFTLNCFAGN
jgi:hypothetical protein